MLELKCFINNATLLNQVRFTDHPTIPTVWYPALRLSVLFPGPVDMISPTCLVSPRSRSDISFRESRKSCGRKEGENTRATEMTPALRLPLAFLITSVLALSGRCGGLRISYYSYRRVHESWRASCDSENLGKINCLGACGGPFSPSFLAKVRNCIAAQLLHRLRVD